VGLRAVGGADLQSDLVPVGRHLELEERAATLLALDKLVDRCPGSGEAQRCPRARGLDSLQALAEVAQLRDPSGQVVPRQRTGEWGE
jgi:hypothetical protein